MTGTASQDSAPLKKTPLFETHKKYGAKFTGFGGWEMPVQYAGLVSEHNAVRNAVGLFDVSHMGEIKVEGPHALTFLQYVSTNDVSKLSPGFAQYSLLLNECGGVVDDIIIYMLAEDDYLLCVNASNTDKDFAWLQARNKDSALAGSATLKNVSSDFAQIAVQGPKARALISSLLLGNSSGEVSPELTEERFPSFTFQQRSLSLGSTEIPILLASTGYTGEDGFELFCPPHDAPLVWDSLMEQGTPLGIQAAGLGARDTLRLEACYPLHGHELSDTISALCSNVSWVIKLKKKAFFGKSALEQEKEGGILLRLRGVEVLVPGIVREGAKLFSGETEVGWVSSGTKPPTINKAVGLAFLKSDYAADGRELEAEVRGRRLAVRVIPIPFYKRSA